MINGDKLEMYYTCPECGEEGFEEDLEKSPNKCCEEYSNELK
jgi:DNA-directed RNA polymerase subunit RPC12/RpoP